MGFILGFSDYFYLATYSFWNTIWIILVVIKNNLLCNMDVIEELSIYFSWLQGEILIVLISY